MSASAERDWRTAPHLQAHYFVLPPRPPAEGPAACFRRDCGRPADHPVHLKPPPEGP